MSVRCRPARSSLSSTTLTWRPAPSSAASSSTCSLAPLSAWLVIGVSIRSTHISQVWQGRNAVATGRTMLGQTKPQDSAPGTIRGDFAVEVGRCVHFVFDITYADRRLQQHLPRQRQRRQRQEGDCPLVRRVRARRVDSRCQPLDLRVTLLCVFGVLRRGFCTHFHG